MELQAQRATLQEQRSHIDILDHALNNAQNTLRRLEEEVNILNFSFHFLKGVGNQLMYEDAFVSQVTMWLMVLIFPKKIDELIL